MAQKQLLIGVCFAALQWLGFDADVGFARIGMSEMLYLTWVGMAATIQQKNGVVNKYYYEHYGYVKDIQICLYRCVTIVIFDSLKIAV